MTPEERAHALVMRWSDTDGDAASYSAWYAAIEAELIAAIREAVDAEREAIIAYCEQHNEMLAVEIAGALREGGHVLFRQRGFERVVVAGKRRGTGYRGTAAGRPRC
jgi:hypothetical protein